MPKPRTKPQSRREREIELARAKKREEQKLDRMVGVVVAICIGLLIFLFWRYAKS